MTLYLPPEVAAERRREFAAEIDRRCDHGDPIAQEWTRKLQRLDPRLMMVRARQLIPVGTPLVPGFFHVLRVNDDAPMSVFAVNENGSFAYPDSRVFDRLAAGDLHDPRTLRRWADEARREFEAVERDKERDNADRQEEVKDRVNAATRATISMLPGWSQNQSARRGRR